MHRAPAILRQILQDIICAHSVIRQFEQRVPKQEYGEETVEEAGGPYQSGPTKDLNGGHSG